MRHSFLENVVLLLVINFFANGSYTFLAMVVLSFKLGFSDNLSMTEEVVLAFGIIVMCILLFLHIFVLPIAYKKLEKSKKFIYISRFIKRLKQSWKLKLIVLVIAYFSCFPRSFFSGEFAGEFIGGIMFGLLGSYIVLYVYWYIEDIIQKDKMNGLINKRYKL